MFGNRLRMTAQITNITPAHLGSGDTFDLPRADGGNEMSEVWSFVRDHEGKPYLPPTTIKGMMRRIAEEVIAEPDRVAYLFGPRKKDAGNDEGSRSPSSGEGSSSVGMGRLMFRGCSMDAAPPYTSDLPYVVDKAVRSIERINGEGVEQLRENAFVAVRTAINTASGVAADNRLFFQEMLPQGARFNFEILLLADDNAEIAKRAEDDFRLLMQAAISSGLQLGKGGADGNGEFHFVNGQATLTEQSISPDGSLVTGNSRKIEAGELQYVRDTKVEKFTLHCAGPFIVIDSSHNAAVERQSREQARKGDRPQIMAQRRSPKSPLLFGSSISGVARARALWLAKCAQNTEAPELEGVEPTEVVAQLFGTTSHKALVHIRGLDVSDGTPLRITSLKTDRFAGGGVDGALFTTEAFTDVTVKFRLELRKRKSMPEALEPAVDHVFKLLCEDIDANGLMLGHGSAKGFGWFLPKGKEQTHGA